MNLLILLLLVVALLAPIIRRAPSWLAFVSPLAFLSLGGWSAVATEPGMYDMRGWTFLGFLVLAVLAAFLSVIGLLIRVSRDP